MWQKALIGVRLISAIRLWFIEDLTTGRGIAKPKAKASEMQIAESLGAYCERSAIELGDRRRSLASAPGAFFKWCTAHGIARDKVDQFWETHQIIVFTPSGPTGKEMRQDIQTLGRRFC